MVRAKILAVLLLLAPLALVTLLSTRLEAVLSGWCQAPATAGLQARVSLSPSKRVYKLGEPIILSYRVENAGSEPFYVYPNFNLSDGSGAGFGVTIEDDKGKPIRRYVVSESFPTPYNRLLKVAEHIRTEWILLYPKAFYGASNSYNDRPPQKPGRYRITGAYWNRIPDWLSEEQRQSLRDLEHPILTGVHWAKPVWIEVRK